jgi:D-psicose/D-tagatose/L-ribulose 3-epimerase
MHLGLNFLLFSGRPGVEHRGIFTELRKIGYQWLELPIFDPADKNIPELSRILADEGFALSVSSALPRNASLVTDDAAFEHAFDHHLGLIDAAQTLKTSLIIGPLFHPVGEFVEDVPQKELQSRLVERLVKLDRLYRRRNVRLALEPLNRFETNVVNTCADAASITRQAGCPWLGILADTFHMHIEEKDTPAALNELGPAWIHAHASECHRGVVGAGQVHWQDWAKAIRAEEYRGAIVVEAFSQSLPELAKATRIWRDVTGDPLVLAAESIRFLRNLLKIEA